MSHLVGIQYTDPFTYFGEISNIVLTSSFIAIFGFLIAGVSIYLYYKKFYGVTKAPKGWKVFFIGLILNSLYQMLKVPFTYNWFYGDLMIIIFLIFQLIGIFTLVYGLYLLKKEIEI